MSDERFEKLKAMVRTMGMIDGMAEAMKQGFEQQKALAIKLAAHPGFMDGAVDDLVGRVAQLYASMPEPAVDAVIAFFGSEHGVCFKQAQMQSLPAMEATMRQWAQELHNQLTAMN